MAVALLALAAGEVALVAGVPVADLGAVVVEADIYMIYRVSQNIGPTLFLSFSRVLEPVQRNF